MVGFVTVLICSNLIAPAKVALLFGVSFGVGNVFFPISYIFGDVLTEVYGYSRARRAIWAGFGALIFAMLMSQVVFRLPADPGEPFNEELQPAIQTLFANTPRIVIASIVAFLVGDFINAYVMAKMKVWTNGRWLWTRTIGSTIVGQGADSLIFYPLAFAFVWEGETLAMVILVNWLFKVGVEALMTPATYRVCSWLKVKENEDAFDRDTNFNPFHVKV
jgi:uncharacterized integral membrane protein (TIGR00697 family)